MKSGIENAVIVRSKTRLEQLIKRFNTQNQAKFFISQSKKAYLSKKAKSQKQEVFEQESNDIEQEFEQYQEEHDTFNSAVEQLIDSVTKKLKVKQIDSSFLPNYIFTPKDVIIVIGQDGLVANTAKYVNELPIIAVNPNPEQYDGVLLPFDVHSFYPAFNDVLAGNYNKKMVTMAEAKLNDGQRLLAFNDLFIGVSNHGSSRYRISFSGLYENHSSSGIIVSTGAGSTGWLSSLFNMANGINKAFSGEAKIKQYTMPKDADELVFVVREPFVSKTSTADITAGRILSGKQLTIESLMPQNGVIFSDGIQSDFLVFNSGSIAEIGIAPEKACLVVQ